MDADAQETICHGPCRLPPGSTLVTDADEEIFLLYTALSSKNVQNTGDGFRGLGFIDNRQDVLTLEFVVPVTKKSEASNTSQRKRGHKLHQKVEHKTVEVLLSQDKTALRSRKGDTGSVLWRASADFAQYVLKECLTSATALLDSARLAGGHVLELGAGTGLLAVVFSSLVKQYTVTDIEELVPLIKKNLSLNHLSSSGSTPARGSSSNVTAEALDWNVLKNTSTSVRRSAFSYSPIDLLLVVDCIYHPSLLPALVDTVDYLTTPGLTAVLVIVELRQEDVVREFLELWLAAGGGAWEIWHIEEVMQGPYAMWVGWKNVINP